MPLALTADTIPSAFSGLGAGAQPAALSLMSVGALLELSMGLAAWKEYGPDRWALRCAPSSGNLHPTETYVLARGIDGLADGVYHYAPRAHEMEQRGLVVAAAGQPGLWVGFSSVHWREAWKYGERGFRYCQLDLGHALGALRYAAAALDIALRDVPQIDMLEELHVVTFNDTYWTGWPTAANPYVAPYTPWEAFNIVIHTLKPAGR